MFTGLVEEVGTVVDLEDLPDQARRVTIVGPRVASDARHGDSISVNGVCLTVRESDQQSFTADVMAETLHRSTLGDLERNSLVNLERAVMLGDRLGGHLVAGHVDATSIVTGREDAEHWRILTFQLPNSLRSYIAEKGSVTLDGVSLTVTDVTDDSFSVSLIPTTLTDTIAGHWDTGVSVNLEVDLIARYVARMMETRSAS